MSLSLRPYQNKSVEDLRNAFRAGFKAPLLVSPTGSGKTVLFSYITKGVAEKKKRVMILTHREELLEQVSNTLRDFSVQHSYVAVNKSYERRFPVHVASVFALARRFDRVEAPDLIILDEAHHAIAGSTWGKVIAAYPNAQRIGVTATPQRLSGEGLGDLFDTMVLGPTVKELIAIGALSNYEMYAPSVVDLSDVHSRAGEFVTDELAAAMDKSAITGSAVNEYRKRVSGKRAIAFCVNLEHAEHVAAQFRENGITSQRIDGTMDRTTRRQMVRDFSLGIIKVLTSCNLISEGFDLPAIEAAILLRPTKSLAVYLQQCGRALRIFPGKPFATILDHCGNWMRHGLIDDDREWTLEGRKRSTKVKDEEEVVKRIKQCSQCYHVHEPAPQCPKCGMIYITGQRIEEREGVLEKITPEMVEAVNRQKKREVASAKSLEELQWIAAQRGYKNGWAEAVFTARRKKRESAAA